jgi:hypothetical protein
MATIKRILFPIDFSECSYEVVPYVLMMSEKLVSFKSVGKALIV